MALADWDPRLMTPARALELVGDWPVCATLYPAELSQFEPEGGGPREPDQQYINLRCGRVACGQSVTLLAAGTPGAKIVLGAPTTMADLLSAVLRHLVMAHDLPLSGASSGGAKEEDRG